LQGSDAAGQGGRQGAHRAERTFSHHDAPIGRSTITLAGVVKRLDGIAVGAEAALHLALPFEVLTRCHGANGLGGQPRGVIAA